MLKAGIIGFGGMAQWHLQKAAESGSIEWVGVYDINPEKGRDAEAKGLKSYASSADLLADKSIDIVFVVTPNNFHKEYSIAAMKAGKHVICEKPVTMDTAEYEEIMAVSKETGMRFTVHQNRRWDRDFRIMKEALDQGLIGKPFYIESRVQGSRGLFGDWRTVKVAGGGILLDWGVHLIDQIMWMIDAPVTEIYTHMFNIRYPEVDDNFKLLLKFGNGVSAMVQIDTCEFLPLPRWHCTGDCGSLVVDSWDCTGKIIRPNVGTPTWLEGTVYTSSGPTRTMAPRAPETVDELPLPEVKLDLLDFYRNFESVIRNGGEQLIRQEESLRVMKVIDAVFESWRTGNCIKGSF